MYDGAALNPIAELDGQNNVVSRFIYGTDPRVPDYVVKGSNSYRIVADQLGSPRIVVDAATGQIVQQIDYGPFGEVLSDTSPGFQPLGFAGGLYDLDTGLVRLGARDLDPQVGRWTSKDPILFAGRQANLYGYALADPVNLADENGMLLGIVAGIGGAVNAAFNAGQAILRGCSAGAVIASAGRGFLTGAAAAASGFGVASIGARLLVAGGVGGAVGSALDGALQGGISVVNVGLGAVSGAVAGGVLGRARTFNTTRPPEHPDVTYPGANPPGVSSSEDIMETAVDTTAESSAGGVVGVAQGELRNASNCGC